MIPSDDWQSPEPCSSCSRPRWGRTSSRCSCPTQVGTQWGLWRTSPGAGTSWSRPRPPRTSWWRPPRRPAPWWPGPEAVPPCHRSWCCPPEPWSAACWRMDRADGVVTWYFRSRIQPPPKLADLRWKNRLKNMFRGLLWIRGGGEMVSSRKNARRDVSCLVSSREFVSRDH